MAPSLEWVAKRGLGTHRNLWKDISFELPSFAHLVCCVGEGKETYFWKDQWVGDRPLSSVFPWLCHLSSFKKHQISDSLVWSFCGFCRPLSDKETMKVASPLSLLEEFKFRLGRWDAHVWSPNSL